MHFEMYEAKPIPARLILSNLNLILHGLTNTKFISILSDFLFSLAGYGDGKSDVCEFNLNCCKHHPWSAAFQECCREDCCPDCNQVSYVSGRWWVLVFYIVYVCMCVYICMHGCMDGCMDGLTSSVNLVYFLYSTVMQSYKIKAGCEASHECCVYTIFSNEWLNCCSKYPCCTLCHMVSKGEYTNT